MSEKWAMLAFKCESADFAIGILLDVFPKAGLSLEFPGSSVVKVLDENGEAIDHARSELAPMLEKDRIITFQWWWNESEDLTCGINLVSELARINFFLDGYYGADEDRMLQCLRQIYDVLSNHSFALGMLFDRTRATATYPWLDILAGRDFVRGEFPDQLIVPYETGQRLLRNTVTRVEAVEYGANLVLCAGLAGPDDRA